MRPEIELLLYCSRTRGDELNDSRIRNLSRRALDWEHLARAAVSHGTSGLVYRNLINLRLTNVPEPAFNKLKDSFELNASRNLELTRELIGISRLLKAHELPHLPLKGPTLAWTAYGRLELRNFVDLDLLVRRRDVPKVISLLASRGYRHAFRDGATNEAEDLASTNALVLVSGDEKTYVDLHWATGPKVYPYALELGWLREWLVRVPLDEAVLPGLRPEKLLLSLCVHGAKHGWARLSQICDVAELISSQPALDWEGVMSEATGHGIRRMLSMGALLANELLGTAIPDTVLRRMRADRVAVSLVRQVRARLFSEDCRPPAAFELPDVLNIDDMTGRIYFHLKMMERLSERFYFGRFYLHFFVTPTEKDRAFLPLPEFLSSLYYLLRPVRLFKASGRKLLSNLLYILKGCVANN